MPTQQTNTLKHQAQQYTLAAKDQLLTAAQKIPVPTRLRNMNQKQVASFCFILSLLLYTEHKSGLPLISGTPALLGTIFTNTAYLMQLLANTTDPILDFSATVYTATAAIGFLAYRHKHPVAKIEPAKAEDATNATPAQSAA